MKKEVVLSLIASAQGISLNRAGSTKVSQLSAGPREKIIDHFKNLNNVNELFTHNAEKNLEDFAGILASASGN